MTYNYSKGKRCSMCNRPVHNGAKILTCQQCRNAQDFFYRNAGYVVRPGETKEQAKRRCAAEMAIAEAYMKREGWTTVWRDDPEGCIGCDCGDNSCPCSTGARHRTEYCTLYGPEDTDGISKVLALLGSICEADTKYRRVIEAELAMEAMPS